MSRPWAPPPTLRLEAVPPPAPIVRRALTPRAWGDLARLRAAVRDATTTTRLGKRTKDAAVYLLETSALKVARRPRECLAFAKEHAILARAASDREEEPGDDHHLVRLLAYEQTAPDANADNACSLAYAVAKTSSPQRRSSRASPSPKKCTPIGRTCPAYLLLERCRLSLGDYLAAARAESLSARAERARRDRWGAQLVVAVCYLHAQDVHHLDIKPDNVLVDARDNVRLADFGEAVEGRRSVEQVPPGTDRYMMPVLAAASTTAAAATAAEAALTHYYLKCRDLYALALTLRELCEAPNGAAAAGPRSRRLSSAQSWLHELCAHPTLRALLSSSPQPDAATAHHSHAAHDPYRARYGEAMRALHALLHRRRRFPPALVPTFRRLWARLVVTAL